ncbi:phasin family protein [Cohnella thailandensis]|uniref:Polyhydroxyalkanoate synthesis regulator n=1 Tax=Cohnella thailandensis TaxID=557557 RepID=A0A841SSS0_9BACL|nr:hypothetical protein [Cohnella thailandensis]MBB6633636.1 hypothetical protein [Cohnella thailandensis]MBP1976421.1 polyhydroxyalkanoate synthesis regulator phasin [Cohnella thailandensis]
MRDLISKTISLGLGIAVASKEQVEKLAGELVKKGEMTRAESFAFIDDLLKKGEETQHKLESLIQEKVQKVGERKWATKEDIERIERRLDQLLDRLEKSE